MIGLSHFLYEQNSGGPERRNGTVPLKIKEKIYDEICDQSQHKEKQDP